MDKPGLGTYHVLMLDVITFLKAVITFFAPET